MRRSLLVIASLCLGAATARAQIGHEPSKSPFRQLTKSQYLAVYYGRLAGSGGALGIGPHSGSVLWFQHDFMADRALGLSVAFGTGNLDRNYVNVNETQLRLRGPIQHRLLLLEGGAQLNLTGGKSWHGFSPLIKIGVGLANGEKISSDNSSYKFGTKLYFAPGLGLRYNVTQKLALRAEARTFFWQLSYPATYQADPDDIGPEVPLLNGELSEWTPTPMFSFGIAYSFRRPF